MSDHFPNGIPAAVVADNQLTSATWERALFVTRAIRDHDVGSRVFLAAILESHAATLADRDAEIASLRSQLRLAKAALASALVVRLAPVIASTQLCADCLRVHDVEEMQFGTDDALRCMACVGDIRRRDAEVAQ